MDTVSPCSLKGIRGAECQERRGAPREVGEGRQESSAKDTKCDVDVILARAGALQSLDTA